MSPAPAILPPSSMLDSVAPGFTSGFYGGFWRRLSAMILDGIAIGLISNVLKIIIEMIAPGLATNILAILLFLGLFYLYHVRLIYKYRATPGKMALNLQVVSLHGKNLSQKQAWLRISPYLIVSIIMQGLLIGSTPAIMTSENQEIFQFNSIMLFFSGFSVMCSLWYLTSIIVLVSNPYKRTLHDFIARTVVVYNPPQYIPAAQLPPPQ